MAKIIFNKVLLILRVLLILLVLKYGFFIHILFFLFKNLQKIRSKCLFKRDFKSSRKTQQRHEEVKNPN